MPPSLSSSSQIRSKIPPQLHHRISVTNTNTNRDGDPTKIHHRSVEIWTTTCIITNFGRNLLHNSQQPQFVNDHQNRKPFQRWILINPCNAGLTGCKLFPYFPKGGPVPKQKVESTTHRDWQPLGYVTQWGGMEVGTGMLYPTSVIDGLVHLYGGPKLQTELYWFRQKHRWNQFWSKDGSKNTDVLCPVGEAIITSAGNGPLAQQYDDIVHTTPPFYKYNTHPTYSAETLLAKCYENALHQATIIPSIIRMNSGITNVVVAIPLLGSGARGFPIDVACQVAAESITKWILQPSSLFLSNDNTLKLESAATIVKNGIQQQRVHNPSRIHDNNGHSTVENNFKTAPPPPMSIDTVADNESSHRKQQQQSHERIVFGLLDCTVAEQLIHAITKN